jgi:GntR family transcriptional regulator
MNLHLHIEAHSGLPVYRQMIDQIKYYIASGALKPGDQLPSVRDLAQRLSVNPTTVVKTYAELEHEQVIEIHHGRGAFVSTNRTAFAEFEKERVIRRLARQLVVESVQMGAEFELVDRIVADEWEQVAGQAAPLPKARVK